VPPDLKRGADNLGMHLVPRFQYVFIFNQNESSGIPFGDSRIVLQLISTNIGRQLNMPLYVRQRQERDVRT
jgi:hypothetical protein